MKDHQKSFELNQKSWDRRTPIHEDYSWGGTFNTSSKEKTASITMKLVYDID